jgi:hypothetical protein
MLSLEKTICLKKPPRVRPPCAASPVVYSKLTLAKEPRASHPVIIGVVQLLARQAARAAFAHQLAETHNHLHEGQPT